MTRRAVPILLLTLAAIVLLGWRWACSGGARRETANYGIDMNKMFLAVKLARLHRTPLQDQLGPAELKIIEQYKTMALCAKATEESKWSIPARWRYREARCSLKSSMDAYADIGAS
jgi:hypothetical protein